MEDIFSRLVTLTSYLSRRLIRLIEDLVFRDVLRNAQDSEFPFYGQQTRSVGHIYRSSTGNCSTSSKCSDAGANLRNCDSRETDHKEKLSVNTSSAIAKEKCYWNGSFIFQGLRFPSHVFRLGWRFTLTCLRCSFIYVRNTQIKVQSFTSRVRRTLKGSSEDIGWLQRTQGLPPVEDGTTRFLDLLHGIRNGEHSLPNYFIYLLIPGLFSNHSPLYFVNTKKFFSKMGLACHIAQIHSEASVEKNALVLKQYIEEIYWGSGKRVLLLGHSKGGVDAAAALSIYWSDLKGKVAGLALVQSPYGGTPIASDILRQGQIADKEARSIMEFIVSKVVKGDMQALEDLTYHKRKEFITKHRLPSDQVPLVSFHTEASVGPGVLATMSHIAHAELPWLPLPSFGSRADWDSWEGSRKVPVILPVAAAMAICALHLRLRYGEKSDGMVTRRDAEVPGSVAVRLNRKLDHAWMVYSSWRKNCFEADACEMCEALLTLLAEMGKNQV